MRDKHYQYLTSNYHEPYGYDWRTGVLDALGFRSYAEYLASELWCDIRSRKLKQSPACEVCGKAAFEVHHHSYHAEVLLGNRPVLLVSLCGSCHKWVEFERGRKVSQSKARDRLCDTLIDFGKRRRARQLEAAFERESGMKHAIRAGSSKPPQKGMAVGCAKLPALSMKSA